MGPAVLVSHVLRTCRVLIADGYTDSREMYAASLQATGCDVIGAADGRDALVSALVHRPSLVIMDTHLPVFDGYQLLAVLRQDSVTCDVPVLVVTGDARASARERAEDAGANAVWSNRSRPKRCSGRSGGCCAVPQMRGPLVPRPRAQPTACRCVGRSRRTR